MATHTRRSLIRIATGVALSTLTRAALPDKPAAAETTHEANQAAALLARSAATAAAYTADEAIDLVTVSDGVLRFDVAEDHSRFVWDGNPALIDGMPEHHTAFITQGYLYPAGTLTGTNGVLPDGSPEFPDKVLGQWTCSGWWLGGGEPGDGPLGVDAPVQLWQRVGHGDAGDHRLRHR